MNIVYRNKQSGAVLIVSLILMIVTTLLALIGMESGLMEMRMSGNEESRTDAFQSAQSTLDEVAERIIGSSKKGLTVVQSSLALINDLHDGVEGETVLCTSSVPYGVSSCSDTSLTVTANSGIAKVAVTRLSPYEGPPNSRRRSGDEYSYPLFKEAYYKIEVEQDETASGGGRVKVVQGITNLRLSGSL